MYRTHLASLISSEGMVDRKAQFIKLYKAKPTAGIDNFDFLKSQ